MTFPTVSALPYVGITTLRSGTRSLPPGDDEDESGFWGGMRIDCSIR